MRRTVILASLGFPLLAALVLGLIVARSESPPTDSGQAVSRTPATSPSSGAARANPGASTRPGTGSSSLSAASATRMRGAAAHAEPGRTARSARAALLAAKLQQLPGRPRAPVPATGPAGQGLPPEEVAAMEARGMDWRRLEQMMREGVPREAAAAVERSAPPGEPSDERE